MDSPPKALTTLVERFDIDALDRPPEEARVRLKVPDVGAWDVVIRGRRKPVLEPRSRGRATAVLTADRASWNSIARDVRGGMRAFQRGRLIIRYDLHVGVGFLAATSGMTDDPRRLSFRAVKTKIGDLSTIQAGEGDPLICIHGLGATKASFLPTVSALAEYHRVIAIDLPGFGDSVKPVGAAYDAAFFARSVQSLMDAMGLERAHLAGNSMGGRVALELAMTQPERVGRQVLLTPALAWLRKRPWALPLKLVRPELGIIQPAPRPVVEGIVRRLVPGARDGWTAAGVDEFLRAYMTPRGRAAFYAAARNIYLDAPLGDDGFWSRLGEMEPESMFVWGRQDTLVPIGFRRHVEERLPAAAHLELDCGHVPQLEEPVKVHREMRRFLAEEPLSGSGTVSATAAAA
ncbi:MAG TPA: alpha/beta fold hydrolase [Thermoleophilaceae bacterium]|nr:alpha/beta fold hydrolase [Thermoleophilaceae bacterium]